MDSKILISKNAILAKDFISIIVKQRIKDLLDSANNKVTPKDAYVSTIKELRLSKNDLSEKTELKF
jgi:hypothetical protein